VAYTALVFIAVIASVAEHYFVVFAEQFGLFSGVARGHDGAV
jgi:hypothetical protein